MNLLGMGTLPTTLIASLLIALVLLAIRIFVMQRVQQQRQRENRQETERLKSMVAAYRSLAGSFSPAVDGDRLQIEAARSDIVLFGSLQQVELATGCAKSLLTGSPVDYQPLVEDLRANLRTQLGLEPIPAHLVLPPSGPGPAPMRGEGNRGGGSGRGGGGGGGSGAAGAGGLSVGLLVGDSAAQSGS